MSDDLNPVEPIDHVEICSDQFTRINSLIRTAKKTYTAEEYDRFVRLLGEDFSPSMVEASSDAPVDDEELYLIVRGIDPYRIAALPLRVLYELAIGNKLKLKRADGRVEWVRWGLMTADEQRQVVGDGCLLTPSRQRPRSARSKNRGVFCDAIEVLQIFGSRSISETRAISESRD